jgi:hypothetical protein
MRMSRSISLAGVTIGIIMWAMVSFPQVAEAQTLGQPCNLLRDVVASDPKDPQSPPSDPLKLTPIDASTKDTILKSGLPCAEIVTAAGPASKRIENLQRGFDFYSWLTFIALNAPAQDALTQDLRGIANSRPDTRAAWEDPKNFKQLLEVMLTGDTAPKWEQRVIPAACRTAFERDKSLMVVQMIEESFNQPFKTGPLIDQNNNYAIFDILMNKVMFDYMVAHHLYSRKGQSSAENAGLRIDFPSGHHEKDGVGDPGAIMLKVSWKILEPNDDANKFHHVEALVAMPSTPDRQLDPPCLRKTLGLVGFHIVHKTAGRPQWIWTSFEHVDNVPEQQEVDAHNLNPALHPLKRSYNFYDPSCTLDDCPVNQTPPRPWDPEVQNGLQFRRTADGKMLFNSQITRVVPLTEATKTMNSQFQALLAGTPWKNYMLISTQWPSASPCTGDKSRVPGAPDPRTDFEKQPDMNCAPAPTYLANSTLETFSQGEIPLASSSCMACHGNATSYQVPKNPDDIYFNQSDFTFMLEKAR